MKKLLYSGLLALIVMFVCQPKAHAQIITGHSTYPDSGCYATHFDLTLSSYVTGLKVITYFGDGLYDSSYCYPSTPPTANFGHYYAVPGIYTITCILTLGGVHLDTMTFSYSKSTCKTMAFQAYIDNNSNCIFDAGDEPIHTPAKFEVDSAGVPIDTINTLWGYYYLALGPVGTAYSYRLLAAPAGLTLACPVGGVIYDTVGSVDSFYHMRYMAFTCASGTAFDLAVFGEFRAAAAGGQSIINVVNSSCIPTTATLKMTHSPKFAVYSIDYGPGYTAVVGNQLTFPLGGVSNHSAVSSLIWWSPVGTLVIGDTIHTTYQVTPTSGDADPANNTVVIVDTIRAAWDPNSKSVYPAGDIDPGTSLRYTITFENTGNDTAHNIHIMDTISNNLDFNTFKLLSSSAKVVFFKTNDGLHNIIKFDFPSINLLDSSHHGLCDGMVSYSIIAKAGLAPGTKIDNKAGIYFDVNPVVMTNNVQSKIKNHTGVDRVVNGNVDIYPNPANTELNITLDNSLYNSMTIVNTLGQTLLAQDIKAPQTKVAVQMLPPGMYYINIKGEAGTKVLQFVKM